MQAIKTLYALITIAAFAAVGCARETLNDDKIEGVTFGVSADESNVKSELNDKTLKWTESETMQLFYTTIGGSTWNAASSKQSSLVDGRVNFIFVLPYGTANTLKVKGVTPSTAVSGTDAKNCQITIPVRQQPSSTSYDPAAMIQVASSDSINVIAGWNGASFSPIVALNRLTLKGIDEDLITVEITCDQNFAGNATADLTGSQPLTGDARTVTVGYTTPLVKGAAGHDVFFTSYGATTSSLTITAYTATKKYTKTITKQMTFAAGEYTWYSNVNMTDCGTDNAIVGECLLAAAVGTSGTNWYLMKSDYSGYNTGLVKTTDISCADFYDIPDLDHYRWVISKMPFGYSIQNVATTKYIGEISTTDTKIDTSSVAFEQQIGTTLKDRAYDTLYINTNGVRYINLNNGGFKAMVQISSCPKSLVWEPDNRIERGLQFVSNEVAIKTTTTGYSNSLNGETEGGVQYSSSDPSVLQVDSDGVLTPEKHGSATITAICKGNRTYKPDTASYSVVISAVDPVLSTVTTGIIEYGYDAGSSKYYFDLPVSYTGENISAGNPVSYGVCYKIDSAADSTFVTYNGITCSKDTTLRVYCEYGYTYQVKAWASVGSSDKMFGTQRSVKITVKGLPATWQYTSGSAVSSIAANGGNTAAIFCRDQSKNVTATKVGGIGGSYMASGQSFLFSVPVSLINQNNIVLYFSKVSASSNPGSWQVFYGFDGENWSAAVGEFSDNSDEVSLTVKLAETKHEVSNLYFKLTVTAEGSANRYLGTNVSISAE